HDTRYLSHGHHPCELIRVGEEIAFQGFCVRGQVGDHVRVVLRDFQKVVGGTEAGGLDGAGDVEHGEAFGYDDGVEVNVAAPEALVNVDYVCGLVEEIFSSLERVLVAQVVPEDESFFAANDAGTLEFGGDAVRGVAGAQQDEGLPRGLDGREHGPGEPSRGAEGSERNQPENLAHSSDSLDDGGMGD